MALANGLPSRPSQNLCPVALIMLPDRLKYQPYKQRRLWKICLKICLNKIRFIFLPCLSYRKAHGKCITNRGDSSFSTLPSRWTHDMARTAMVISVIPAGYSASGVREVAKALGCFLTAWACSCGLSRFPSAWNAFLLLHCLLSHFWSYTLGHTKLLGDRKDLVCLVRCHLPKKLTAFNRHWLNND